MRVYNMIKLAGVALGMAVLTGCSGNAPIKANNGINLNVVVESSVPNKVIESSLLKEACLTKLKEKGIEQSDSGTKVTLNVSNFKILSGGNGNINFANKTGFALVDAVNQLLVMTENANTVANNLSNNASTESFMSSVDIKVLSDDKTIMDASVKNGRSGNLSTHQDMYLNFLPKQLDALISK